MSAARVACVLALFAISAAAPILVDAHPNDGRPHVQPFQEVREITVVVRGKAVEFQLDRPTARTVDAIRVTWDPVAAALAYDYRFDEGDPGTSIQHRVVIEKLVEYRDQNGNQRFDASADVEVRSYRPSTFTWDVPRRVATHVDGQPVQYFATSGSFGVGAKFSMELFATGTVVTFAKTPLHPQDVKATWSFSRFPFAQRDSALALVARLEAPVGADWREEISPDQTVAGLVLARSDRMAFFDWAATALGNSSGDVPAEGIVHATVGASRVEGDVESRSIVFSYPRADFLLSHDPTLGFEYAPREKPPVLPVKWFVLAGGVALAGGGFWFARRKGWTHVAGAWIAERWAALRARVRK